MYVGKSHVSPFYFLLLTCTRKEDPPALRGLMTHDVRAAAALRHFLLEQPVLLPGG